MSTLSNAVVLVTTNAGTRHTYVGETLMGALKQFYSAMDAHYADSSSVKSVELFTKFMLNPVDSLIFESLKERGLSQAIKCW